MKKLLAIAYIFLIWSCQPKPDIQAETQALKKAAEDYSASVTSNQFDVVKTFYAPSARVMPPGEATIQGTEAISGWLNGFNSVKNFKAVFSSPEILVDSKGDNGYSVSSVSLSYDDDKGNKVSENMRDFHTWSKQDDGSWKIDIDIWNEVESNGTSIEGTYEYLPPSKGMSSVRGGKFVFLFEPSNGKGPIVGRAGNYFMSGDTVKSTYTHSTNPKEIGTSFQWKVKSWSGDTVTYVVMDNKGAVNGGGKAIRVGN